MKKVYVQYGCGLSAPDEWINFDASPTLRIQKIPVVGNVLKSKLNVIFPRNVKYGDIVKGLPLKDNSCDAVYCSHVLEHLSLNDFRIALKNTYNILKPCGVFRCVVPDLEVITKAYLASLESDNETASINFIGSGTLLGTFQRPRVLKEFIKNYFGNSNHLWMWDHHSLSSELRNAGFLNIRKASFNDNPDQMFKLVEDALRFEAAVALEAVK